MNPTEFYRRLFAPVEATLGPLDKEMSWPAVDFMSGGPLKLCTIGGAPADGSKPEFVTYLSADLTLLNEQMPSTFGRFELMVTCDCQPWAQDVLTAIGAISLQRKLDEDEWIDLHTLIYGDDPLRWILLEHFSDTEIEGARYGIMRCIAVTDEERKYAEAHGKAALFEKLAPAKAYPQVEIYRESRL